MEGKKRKKDRKKERPQGREKEKHIQLRNGENNNSSAPDLSVSGLHPLSNNSHVGSSEPSETRD